MRRPSLRGWKLGAWVQVSGLRVRAQVSDLRAQDSGLRVELRVEDEGLSSEGSGCSVQGWR
eukprot:2986283-Rhodomonas_salina.2